MRVRRGLDVDLSGSSTFAGGSGVSLPPSKVDVSKVGTPVDLSSGSVDSGPVERERRVMRLFCIEHGWRCRKTYDLS